MFIYNKDIIMDIQQLISSSQSNDDKVLEIVEGIRKQRKYNYYQKKEQPMKRGAKPIYITEEQKEARRQELLDYHKQYYQSHKDDLKKRSYSHYKKNLDIIREIKMRENPSFKPRIRRRTVLDSIQENNDFVNINDDTDRIADSEDDLVRRE